MIVVGGCRYPKNYQSIAYPLYQSPHGGIWKQIPKYYQDYDEEIKKQQKYRQQQEKQKTDKEKENFFKRFFGGFFGFDSEEPEILEPDYPFNVFGLKKSASNEDMKKAYRKSILKNHPDKGGSSEAFRRIQEAWEYFKSKVS
jgi:hypothetical protein